MSMQELFPWRTQGRHAAPKSSDDLLMPLHQGIDRLFSDFFGADLPRLARFQWDGGFSPSMDVSETDGQLEVTAELPSLDEKDVEVSVSDGVLTIKGEKKSETKEEDKDRSHYRLERSYGSFRCSFQLPQGVDADKVSASFDKGVLKISIAKTEAARTATRKIEVKKAA